MAKSTKTVVSKQDSGSRRTVMVLVFLLLLAVGFGGYSYWRYTELEKDPLTAAVTKNQTESEQVVESLKAQLLITEQEAPTVARVDDVDKIKSSNQEFYKDVQKGDYLIAYPTRAILYRLSNKQIINIAPIVDISNPTTQDNQ